MLINNYFLSLLIPVFAGSYSLYRAQWKSHSVLFKFLTTFSLILILGAFYVNRGASGSLIPFILAAFVFSILGDYQLTYRNKFKNGFIKGILFFFLAHIAYLTGFLSLSGRLNIMVFIVAFLVAGSLYMFLFQKNIKENSLKAAVAMYVLISVLVLSAAFSLEGPGTVLLKSAIFLIAVSDIIIGWNAFFRPLKYDELLILSTYYSAQILLTASVLLV